MFSYFRHSFYVLHNIISSFFQFVKFCVYISILTPRRHERFEEWSREELEEDYEKLEQPQSKVERYMTIRWILIAVLCAFLGYYFGSMNTELKYLEQRIEQLQQEVNLIEYQNEQLEDNVDTLSDIVDLIII